MIAYVDRYPSQHPGLEHLIDRLAMFLQSDLCVQTLRDIAQTTSTQLSPIPRDVQMLQQAAALDVAHARAFDAAQRQSFDGSLIPPDQLGQLMTQPLRFHSAWFRVDEQWSHVADRRRVQAADVADDADGVMVLAQPLPQMQHWVVYRDQQDQVREEHLGPLQARLIDRLVDGASLLQACQALMDTESAQAVHLLQAELGQWFQRWTSLGWFQAPGDVAPGDQAAL